MNKYLQVFKISFAQEFAYKVNFIMWRVRNVIQIFLIFYLWDTIFSEQGRVLFGYDRSKILTYVFAILIMKAIVFSSRSIDVSGEISQGNLSNYLLKPLSFFRYWFTRDIASKFLNIAFSFLEITLLYFLFRPPFFLQANPLVILTFFVSVILAIVLYFLLINIFAMMTLWYPDQGWGVSFLLFILSDFLGGGIFPLDVLPEYIQSPIYLTPFPYLIFMPIQIYLGKLGTPEIIRTLGISALWCLFFVGLLRYIWNTGLKVYKAEGR